MTHRTATAQHRPARRPVTSTGTRIAAVAAAGGIAVAAGLLPAVPALAHGAPALPLSRTAACAAGGTDTGSAACAAARKANGRAFGTFDNLRVPGVDGKDRQFIPDGELCSGGLPEFKGLDLARADWPATRMTAGGSLTIRYRTTIPHEGLFRVYLTKSGYDPARPLRWSDLGSQPILTADNPPVRDGAYQMRGRLPADRTGRHVLFTIWQTTSTPDTYYSCSDLVLAAGAGTGAAATPRPSASSSTAKPATSARPLASRSPEPGAVATPDEGDPKAAAPVEKDYLVGPAEDQTALGRGLLTAALIVGVGVTAAIGLRRLRGKR
ncbi:chitin-binding protein [Krasilnikovia cinnamomea]|uniref:Chitin-binding protein n=1 Tax=Krasilnikovia cinnamomea TaxID=349313 RepID=A0A4Q7ZCN1_9ACTN|nr:lytic polysaccharide monooxygenase [Krasilnikovia cinnamomea]RZU48422.1 chitin-binding protein [Krasilnikovia cinnamomea]